MCSVYTGEYALPGSESLQAAAAAARGPKRGRDTPERSAAAKRPSAAMRAAAVAKACVAPASKNGNGGTAAERRCAAPGLADEELVQDTPDTHGGSDGRAGGRGTCGPVLEPGMVQITVEEEGQLRRAAAQAEGLQRELHAAQQHAAAQTRRGDEQEAAAAGARAVLQARDVDVAQLQQCVAAAQADAEAAGAGRVRLQTRADELARENEALQKRVRPHTPCTTRPMNVFITCVSSRLTHYHPRTCRKSLSYIRLQVGAEWSASA